MVPIIFRGLYGYVWVYGLTYSLYHSILHNSDHCRAWTLYRWWLFCGTILKSLLRKSSRINFDFIASGKNNQVLVLFWFGCAYHTRFNVTCDVTTVLILFTQSFKVVSVLVEVRELIFFKLGYQFVWRVGQQQGFFLMHLAPMTKKIVMVLQEC